MSQQATDKVRITLDGDWSMNGVNSQIRVLIEQLAALGDFSSRAKQATVTESQPEVVLTGIDQLDASGCQLLTIFVQALKQKGIIPLLTEVPAEVREKIHSLGFASVLGPHFGNGQECL